MFISHANLRQAPITAASKINLNSWKPSGLRLVDLRLGEKALNLYLTQAVPYDNAKAGAAVAVQPFGDFQNFDRVG